MSRMLEEIRQQPEVLERTLCRELGRIERFRKAGHRPRLIILAARGTSDNAAQFARYFLEISTGIPVSLAAPSIYTLYQAQVDLRDVLVVAISQSGESTDTNRVLEMARARGALTIGITNEAGSSLAGLAGHVFLVHAGREKSVAATKTYTGQLLVLYLVAYALGARITVAALQRLPEIAARALELEPLMVHLSERYRYMRHAVVVGRGLNYASAFEFALKLMETCYVVAERFSSADFLHGPIAMVEPDLPVFLFAPSGPTWSSVSAILDRLRSLRAEALIISDRSNRLLDDRSGRVVRLPLPLKEQLTPIPYIVPAQLFAAHLAAHKGLNPDQPRTLSKVTRTL